VKLLPIKNPTTLVKGKNKVKKARALAVYLIDEALKGLNPIQLVKNSVKITEQGLHIGDRIFKASQFENVVIIGGGKASGEMLLALEKILGERISHGTVIVPKDIASDYRIQKSGFWELVIRSQMNLV